MSVGFSRNWFQAKAGRENVANLDCPGGLKKEVIS